MDLLYLCPIFVTEQERFTMEDFLLKEETYSIIGAAMEVHRELGGGMSEPIYQEALTLELQERGIPLEREKELDVFYKGHLLEKKYFADIVCYGEIIVELKSVAQLLPIHEAQLVNYLKITKKKVGILLNFGEKSLIYKRVVCSR